MLIAAFHKECDWIIWFECLCKGVIRNSYHIWFIDPEEDVRLCSCRQLLCDDGILLLRLHFVHKTIRNCFETLSLSNNILSVLIFAHRKCVWVLFQLKSNVILFLRNGRRERKNDRTGSLKMKYNYSFDMEIR